MLDFQYIQELITFLFIILGVLINRSKVDIKIKQIYSLILIFQGASIIILALKIRYYLGIIMLLSGLYFLDKNLEKSNHKSNIPESIIIKLLLLKLK